MSNKLEENMKGYDIIYDTVDEILNQTELGGEAIINALGFKRKDYPSDEQLHKLKDYMEPFTKVDHRGYLRTILMAVRPYREDPIIANVYYIIAERLRAGNSAGKI